MSSKSARSSALASSLLKAPMSAVVAACGYLDEESPVVDAVPPAVLERHAEAVRRRLEDEADTVRETARTVLQLEQ